MTVTLAGIAGKEEQLFGHSHADTIGTDVIEITLTDGYDVGDLIVVAAILGMRSDDPGFGDYESYGFSIVDDASNDYHDLTEEIGDATPGSPYNLGPNTYGLINVLTGGFGVTWYWALATTSLAPGDKITLTTFGTYVYAAGYAFKYVTDTTFDFAAAPVGIEVVVNRGDEGAIDSTIVNPPSASPIATNTYGDLAHVAGDNLLALTLLIGAAPDGGLTPLPGTEVQDDDDIVDDSGLWVDEYLKSIGSGELQDDLGTIYKFWSQVSAGETDYASPLAEFESSPSRRVIETFDEVDYTISPSASLWMLHIYDAGPTDSPIGAALFRLLS